jgi:hypothetical protein
MLYSDIVHLHLSDVSEAPRNLLKQWMDVRGASRDDYFHINKFKVFHFYFSLKHEGKRSLEKPPCRRNNTWCPDTRYPKIKICVPKYIHYRKVFGLQRYKRRLLNIKYKYWCLFRGRRGEESP